MFFSWRFAALALTMLILPTLVGCKTPDLRQRNEALYRENQELREQLDRTRSALDAAESDRESLVNEVQRLESQPAPAPAAAPDQGGAADFAGISGVETTQTDREIQVRVPGDVLFPAGRVELRETSKRTLAQIADVLKREYGGNIIRVEGYTDTDPIRKSKWTDNLELSLQRAAAVHRYLQEQGISSDRMYAAGFGEANPQATKAKSRRVEIVVELQ